LADRNLYNKTVTQTASAKREEGALRQISRMRRWPYPGLSLDCCQAESWSLLACPKKGILESQRDTTCQNQAIGYSNKIQRARAESTVTVCQKAAPREC
jgi:hypothetical protein